MAEAAPARPRLQRRPSRSAFPTYAGSAFRRTFRKEIMAPRRLAGMGICALAVWTASGSAAPQQESQKPAAVFRTGVELMNLSVTVTDKRGRSITDLTKD